MTPPHPDILRRLGNVLQEASKLARRSSVQNTVEKGTLDYVTNVDHELDTFLTARLAVEVVNAPVLSEERPIAGVKADGGCPTGC